MGNFAENLNLGNRVRPPPGDGDVLIKIIFSCGFFPTP